MSIFRTEVPCNGCTLCCHNDAIRILPRDDPSKYKLTAHPYIEHALMLAHKSNGDCFYLEDGGCSIHDDAPQMCREMDCRNVAQNVSYTKARKQGPEFFAIWRKGKRLSKEVALNV